MWLFLATEILIFGASSPATRSIGSAIRTISRRPAPSSTCLIGSINTIVLLVQQFDDGPVGPRHARSAGRKCC